MRVRAHFDDELAGIRRDLHALSELVLTAVGRAVMALARQDGELATQVVADDRAIDQAQHLLEDRAITLIALQQPVARDLRNLLVAITTASELERIGDYAKGVAKLVAGPEGSVALNPPSELIQLGYDAHTVLSHALTALDVGDEVGALAVADEEVQIDRQYRQVKADLALNLVNHPMPERAVDLLFIAHNFERIADRATNVSERVVYGASATVVALNP
ncbi:MAG: phosphate signaling complex protein PhoU [Oscillochloridaceae bacterium umkhey_bin13]